MRKRTTKRTTRKHPTLEDVAEMVGVSPSTVSRAMSTPDRVSKKTRERIEAAVAKVGFVPNLLAGGLAANQNRIIVFVVPTIYSYVGQVHRPQDVPADAMAAHPAE